MVKSGNVKFIYNYLDRLPYLKALELMEEKVTEVVQQKMCYVFFLEHEKIFTAGIKTNPEHIHGNIEVIRARRGGSVTVHSPGQLILYAVFPLAAISNNLEKYIRTLEQSMLNLLDSYNIKGFQDNEHTGVWTKSGKIGFIGIGAKKGAVYHGAALNVFNDLGDYDPISSCGLELPVTTMSKETRIQRWNLEEIAQKWFQFFKKEMEYSFP